MMYRPDGTSDNWIPKDVLEAEGYSVIPNSLINHWPELGLTRSELTVVLALICSRRSRGTFPSLPLIAQRSGFSRRGVIKILDSLKSKGLIRVSRHPKARSNSYDLSPLWEKLSLYQNSENLDSEPSSPYSELSSPGGEPSSPLMVNPVHPSNTLFNNSIYNNSSITPKSIVKTKSLLKTRSIEKKQASCQNKLTRDDFIKALKRLGFSDDELGGN